MSCLDDDDDDDSDDDDGFDYDDDDDNDDDYKIDIEWRLCIIDYGVSYLRLWGDATIALALCVLIYLLELFLKI